MVSALQVAISATVFRYRQLMHVQYGRHVNEYGKKLVQWYSRFLHKDRPVAHSASCSSFWSNNGPTLVQPAPNSPFLARCDFFLAASEVGIEGKGKFLDIAAIQQRSLATVVDFGIEDVWKCFQQRCNHWDRCITFQGDCLKGNSTE